MFKYNKYKPKRNSKDATIIFTHGIAEYSKSYQEFAEALTNNGYSVITYDLKGHGTREGYRGVVDSYYEVLEDLDFLVQEAYKETKKVFLYGHSLGGVITNLYVKHAHQVTGIIITSSPAKLSLLMKILNLFPKRLTNKIKIKTDFADPNLAKENNYIKDENDLDYFYYKYLNEVLVKGLKRLKKPPFNKNIPALFIYSENDKMAPLKNGKILYDKTKSNDKTLLIYKKSRHNLHLDIEKKQLFVDVVNWLNKH